MSDWRKDALHAVSDESNAFLHEPFHQEDYQLLHQSLERFSKGEVALVQRKPIIWKFAFENEFHIKLPPSFETETIEKIRHERIAFREKKLASATGLEADKLRNQIEALRNHTDFQDPVNLILCEINDQCHEKGITEELFGAGMHGQGYYDSVKVAEIRSNGPQSADEVIAGYNESTRIIREVAGKYNAKPKFHFTHINYSQNIEVGEKLVNILRLQTPEALKTYANGTSGMIKATSDAAPMHKKIRDAVTLGAADSGYSLTAGGSRGKAIRILPDRSEARSIGILPDITHTLYTIVGGTEQGMLASNSGKREKYGITETKLKKAGIFEAPQKHHFLKRIMQSATIEDDGKIALSESYQKQYGWFATREFFPELSEKYITPYRHHDTSVLIDKEDIFVKRALSIFDYIDIDLQNLTIDTSRLREYAESDDPKRPAIVQDIIDNHLEGFLKALQQVKITGHYQLPIHPGHPDKRVGTEHHETNLQEMVDSPLLEKMYGKESLQKRADVLRGKTIPHIIETGKAEIEAAPKNPSKDLSTDELEKE